MILENINILHTYERRSTLALRPHHILQCTGADTLSLRGTQALNNPMLHPVIVGLRRNLAPCRGAVADPESCSRHGRRSRAPWILYLVRAETIQLVCEAPLRFGFGRLRPSLLGQLVLIEPIDHLSVFASLNSNVDFLHPKHERIHVQLLTASGRQPPLCLCFFTQASICCNTRLESAAP